MTHTIETQKFPVVAGMPLNKRGTSKPRKIGYDVIEFTYLLHPDGDKQLIAEKRVKRVFIY